MKISNSTQTNIKKYLWWAIAAWTLSIGLLFGLYLGQERQQVLDFAGVHARSSLNKDLAYRRWNAGFGGVYVPITESNQPNPYLRVTNRDVITTDGLALTLINPAYMTRQVHELGGDTYGERGHITSLNPTRPENAPDAWEAQALKAIKQGAIMERGVESRPNGEYLRVMVPFVTEENCLKCHAYQGYEVGDVQGGVSIAVALAPYQESFVANARSIGFSYGLLWFAGLGGILFAGYRINWQVQERERAEDSLRESEKRSRALVEAIPDLMFRVHPDGTIWDYKDDQPSTLYVSPETFLNRNLGDILPPSVAAPCYEALNKAISSGELQTFEYQLNIKGVVADYEARVVADQAGESVFIVRDVTKRKKSEEQIKRALAEKETLLRELHHRTKNNMNVIIALLDMQAARLDEERLYSAFADAENRIRAMSLVHQKLYETNDLSHINLKEYANSLAALVMESYSVLQDQVSIVSEMEDVFVLIDTAIPCGLILNELISNALKYAFPTGRKGTISIKLRRLESGDVLLVVADDGVGMPAGFDVRQDGHLGLNNIFLLGENQLKAKIHFETQHGVCCQLQFRDDLYQARV